MSGLFYSKESLPTNWSPCASHRLNNAKTRRTKPYASQQYTAQRPNLSSRKFIIPMHYKTYTLCHTNWYDVFEVVAFILFYFSSGWHKNLLKTYRISRYDMSVKNNITLWEIILWKAFFNWLAIIYEMIFGMTLEILMGR